ncbi:flagellar hook-basal body complex protein FliE [Rhizobium sp. G187]|uniref:flagellar hook-basal body complex protein FliE n=1 Tax=unclassified Rhizobium TaxID=2613769 RepID=UPI0006B93A44|nr:flagellar hook-basal body complex protein FliE [Rhizobium sp. AAP43]KPF42057.1 flagellar hook-basal body protein FliE [Rhizobium sp. AAP43]
MIESISKLSALSGTKSTEALTSLFESPGTTLQGTTPGTATGETFMQALGNVAVDAANSLKRSEQASFDGLTGKANTREVVDAVMQAEQSLQTAIAFRDKIVSAYLEITKMQI